MSFEQITDDTTDTHAAPTSDAATPDATPPSSSGTDTTHQAPEAPASLDEVIEAAFKMDAPGASETPDDKQSPGAQDDEGADEEGDGETEGADKSKEPAEGGSDTKTDDADEPAEAELAAMAPRTRKRVQQLLAQRKDAQKQIEALRPEAEGYQAVRRFMAENDLSDPEVAELFQIGALMKSGNPDALGKVLDRLEPLVNQLKTQLGREVPDDLRTLVDNGEMTEDAARQMARTRTQAAFADVRAQRATQQAAQVQTQAQQAQITQAVLGWHEQIRQTDPDFGLKSQALQRAAQALVAERGAPRNPTEAVEYAKAAYAEVNKWFQSARPAPKATRPAPSTAAAPRSGLAPAPTTLAQAIEQAFEASAHR